MKCILCNLAHTASQTRNVKLCYCFIVKRRNVKIDTVYMYHNEEAIGRTIRNSNMPREEFFVITKIYPSQFKNAEEAVSKGKIHSIALSNWYIE